MSREDVGLAQEGGVDNLKAAASDALKRCAVQFGIGRYLYDLPQPWVDWDDTKRLPVNGYPALPSYALPEHERSAGAGHIIGALHQLRRDFPEDLDVQRAVYKHLKDALNVLAKASAP